jgi:hypothetical protein
MNISSLINVGNSYITDIAGEVIIFYSLRVQYFVINSVAQINHRI